jgi:energy-coupling factor transporter ATP-binding protein EcfA2
MAALDTDPALVDAVLAAASADSKLPEDAKYLVVASLEGEEAFAAELGGTWRRPERSAVAGEPDPEPVGAYLSSISVAGFRGIGPEQELQFRPGEGLTVVAGRNGSGKSSFAEALEIALTGESSRRRVNSAEWDGSWTNVHSAQPRHIRVTLATEPGTTTIGVDWPPGTSRFPELDHWVQRPPQRRERGLDSLGWDRAVQLCTPLLPHEELGRLLTAPRSELYDNLEKILGLGHFAAALDLLAAAHQDAARPEKDRKAALTPLKRQLAEATDERAQRAHTELRKHHPDLPLLRALATGTAETPAGPLARLRALAELTVPDPAALHAAAARLREAAARVPDDERFDRIDRCAQLRAEALALHERHGDQTCPACGTGKLDAAWHAVAVQDDAREQPDELRRLRTELRTRRTEVDRLVGGLPVLTPIPSVELGTLPRAVAAVAAARVEHHEHATLADHLDAVVDELGAAFAALRADAAAELARRQDAWVPLAERVGAYVTLAERAHAAAPRLGLVTAARDWLRANVERLRNEQFAPFAVQAQAIWDQLRQESNVDITGIHLPNPKGNNVRAVAFGTAVDGTDASGRGVLSTGELHALTLALFLPRATRPDSPFRFVVLDDPIQAMDPSKIDGFVRVLREIAADRQVIVFSHDDRLPETVRRLAPEATIVEVRRGAGSVVDIGSCEDPAARNLADAEALASDGHVPPDLLRQVVPRLCRAAFEDATRDAWYARACANGVERTEREDRWRRTRANPARLALALYGDAKRDVSSWLDRQPSRRRAMDVCGRQAHEGLTGPPHNAINDVTELVAAVRQSR